MDTKLFITFYNTIEKNTPFSFTHHRSKNMQFVTPAPSSSKLHKLIHKVLCLHETKVYQYKLNRQINTRTCVYV